METINLHEKLTSEKYRAYLVNRADILQGIIEAYCDAGTDFEIYLKASSDLDNIMEKLYQLDNT